MARRLTARQRNKLPPSAFLYPKGRRFPVPTASQAKAAGISEAQRIGIHRSALARAGQQASNSKRGAKTITPAMARRKVKARAGGKVASVKKAPARRGKRHR